MEIPSVRTSLDGQGMEHMSNIYQTLHDTRDNQFAISNQHVGHHKSRARNNSPYQQQGHLCWNEKLRSKGITSLCLGIFCLLLLAGTIIQNVILISGKRQGKGQESIENLTLQRDNLLKGLSEVDENIQKGWWYYNLSVYYVSEDPVMSWTESRQFCKTKNADLVIITSLEEQKFIETLPKAMNVWIGLTDRDNKGVWKWVDGTPLTNGFWSQNQPWIHGNELCVKSVKNSSIEGKAWEICFCNYNANFICEKKIF